MTKLLVFFTRESAWKKYQTPTHFYSSCQFRNPNISNASKLVTDVACGTDAHTWQERREVEEIQEEQERGWEDEGNVRVEAGKLIFWQRNV